MIQLFYSNMLHLRLCIFGLVACFVGSIKVDVTIKGSHVESIPQGSDVILNCSVPQGDNVDRFDWLKGNQSVTGHVVSRGDWWSSLLLQNVSPVNTTAMYTCRTWKNNSINATLPRYVCVDDIVLKVDPWALFLDEGESSVITCTVQASCDVPSLQWLDQSGNVITDKHRVESTSWTELKLKLSKVKQKDGGLYSCRALNSAGREVKKEMTYLAVREVVKVHPPLITSPHQHVDCYYGNNVTLSFSTQYTPRVLAHDTWYYKGKLLTDSSKYCIHNPSFSDIHHGLFSMTVYNVTEDDSGNYTLRVVTFEELAPGVGNVKLTVHGQQRAVRGSFPPSQPHPSVPIASWNKTDVQAISSKEQASRKSLEWIPITVAGIFMLVVMVIGFTCLFIKRHQKIKKQFFFQGVGSPIYPEEKKDHAHSHQAEHELHSHL